VAPVIKDTHRTGAPQTVVPSWEIYPGISMMLTDPGDLNSHTKHARSPVRTDYLLAIRRPLPSAGWDSFPGKM
jgi:hypothetical protein